MSDFQIGKSASVGEIKFATGRTSDFTRLKTKYRDFKAKIEKSDFANSPVAMQEELDMLIELRKLAKKEKLQGEAKWIEEREEFVKENLTTTKINLIANAYYAPVNIRGFSAPQVETPDEKLLSLLNSCKNDYGILDPNAEKVLLALKGKDKNLYHVEQVLAACKESDGSVVPQRAEAIVKLANAGIANSALCELLSEFTYYDEDLKEDKIDFEAIDEVVSLKSEGLADRDAVKFAQYLNGNFADKGLVKSGLIKMRNADISTDSIIKIMDTLAVKNPNGSAIDISQGSINSIVTLKKALSSTRSNETNERFNKINLLDVEVYDFGDTTMVTKNGKITYSTPVEGENYEVTKERYADLIASIEDNMLLEFASKYKNHEGEIDSKFVRVASYLRNAGMVYNGLFNLMESCINEDGSIDTEKLSAIKTIRAAGALSDDVPMLVDACHRDESGKYSIDDINLITELTSDIVGGKDVCSLLPVIRDNEDARDIIMTCAPYFTRNENLLSLVNMMKKPDGEFGENEMEVLYDLASNYFADESNCAYGDDFIKIANEIMTISRDKDGVISDDAAGICAIMNKAGESVYAIRNGLTYCYGDDYKVDGKLAQILWDMYLQEASLPEVLDMINACKSDDGKLNPDKADMIISLFEAKYPKEKIAQLVQLKN